MITVTATLFKKKPTAGRAPDRPQHGTANNVAHTHHYHTTINTARRRAVITLLCSYSFTLMMSSNQTSSSKTGGQGRRCHPVASRVRAGRTAPRAGERRARAPLSVPLPSAFHALQSAPAARRRLLLAAYVQRITMRAGTSREAQAQALHSSSCP